MLDFLMISTRTKKNLVEVYPKFIIKKSSDLMIRGGDFYAIWLEDRGLWSTDEQDALSLIDSALRHYADENKETLGESIRVLYLWDAETGMIDAWHKYCQRQMRDSFHNLDENLIFSNTQTSKTDYASKRLGYPLEVGDISSYDRLMSVLYSPEERQKIEWAIGSIISGDSKKIQKFVVLYGAAGTGKSTVLNIIQKLFEGYYSVFDAKALGSSSNSFALEAFKANPLVAIQHDGDLSRIEDNTRLNSLVSHEIMTVNEKFKSTYSNQFKCFLFMGTNKPVRITDGKSGLLRRLIDVSPSGNRLTFEEYQSIFHRIDFELGGIAKHCLDVYSENPTRYDTYIPKAMLGASNDFYNFVEDAYFDFAKADGISLKSAWERYKVYCDDANVNYPVSQRIFREEFKNYFDEFYPRYTLADGTRVRSYYKGFILNKFEEPEESVETLSSDNLNLDLVDSTRSIFDDMFSKCPAQYANDKGIPIIRWDDVETTLLDLDPTKTHYVRVPENIVVIDFDIRGDDGQAKDLYKNIEAASKWPPTYAEVSKSGEGIHLVYEYTEDPSLLSRVYDANIEVKVFTGKSSLRRRLTKCNDLPIAKISSGLPLKGDVKMIDSKMVRSERGLRTLIKRNLNKEIHPGTKPSIDFIHKILEDAYASDLVYDVSNMRNAVLSFAANSTNHPNYCIKLVNDMKFKSEKESPQFEIDKEMNLIFFDVEVFPNLFLVNWKIEGEEKPVVRMINPSPEEIEELVNYKLVGFNNRRYDNHILYARLMGYTNVQLYKLSQRIVSGDKNAFFRDAFNLSYTDVYDFSSKKQSLKKFEIDLGIHHQELGLPWDEPVPEDMWVKVAEYCDNDVIATEKVFNARKADYIAREILADVAEMTVNDTTNTLTTKIIFGRERNPQEQFNYRDMGDPHDEHATSLKKKKTKKIVGDPEYTVFDEYGRCIFPGYKYDFGVSTYRGEEVGEGGYVYSEPGMYSNVTLLDIASMHPSSIVAEELFGSKYTERFNDILKARIAIKHGDFETARSMLGGKLEKYLSDESTAKDLAQALKIAINSVYGLTSAKFNNAFKDIRNKDNIVAKRGALFMINLKHEVQSRGYTVVHIKTDSIKIPDADAKIVKFVTDYGKQYGYIFEHEATYDRMCLVNDSTYIAYYDGRWSATGAQFQVPYVFKTLFTKQPIQFEDLCETRSVTTSLYLDMNESLTITSQLDEEYGKRVRQHYKENPSAKTLKDLTEIVAQKEQTGYVISYNTAFATTSFKDLAELVSRQHDYHFVGKIGQFCPVKAGCGGGKLVRLGKNGLYSSVTGTKGYSWMESEMVRKLDKEDCIDRTYYDKLVDSAVKTISKFGDLEWFTDITE